jgi:proton-translocating NADH-quinone oxidoreductase chain L
MFNLSILTSIITLILLLSIGSFLVPFLFGRILGFKGIQLLSTAFSFFSVYYSSILLYIHISASSFLHLEWKSFSIFTLKLIKWIKIDVIDINFGILIDPLSVIMLFVVSIISFCANIYSMEYMSNDPYVVRYFSYLALFTFFMLVLVTSENIVQLFIGWEGVGICSYILINFWYCRIPASKASILAILANKFGDIALLIAAALMYFMFKSGSFIILNNLALYIKEHSDKIIFKYYSIISSITLNNVHWITSYELTSKFHFTILLCIVACVGKSAQFGFHFWLPEAMEGPTPVSSLIHAATMVTAGIFLILRISNLLTLSTYSYVYILIIGSVTLFFAATIGITQVDIKKIVAYSTCSQLGYMFLCCGTYGFSNAFFHLFIHAFFKALLFLASGYIIHLLCNEQDIRKMGGLLKISPLSYNFVLIGSAALIGFPFIAGWYSKEFLVEFILSKSFNSTNIYSSMFSNFAIVLSFLTVVVTLLYSMKSIFEIFLLRFNGYKYYIKNIHYSGFFINIPLVILTLFSIYSGYVFSDLFVGINANYLLTSLSSSVYITNIVSEYIIYYRFFLISLLVYFIILYVFIRKITTKLFYILVKNNTYIYNLHYAVSKKYIYVNRFFLYNNIKASFNYCYNITYKLIDKGLLENIGPYGVTYNLYHWATKTNKFQTGYIYHYIGYIFIVLILLIYIILYLLSNIL